MPLPASNIAAAAQLACRLEATAPKPGNVSPGRPFHDLRFEAPGRERPDFRRHVERAADADRLGLCL